MGCVVNRVVDRDRAYRGVADGVAHNSCVMHERGVVHNFDWHLVMSRHGDGSDYSLCANARSSTTAFGVKSENVLSSTRWYVPLAVTGTLNCVVVSTPES